MHNDIWYKQRIYYNWQIFAETYASWDYKLMLIWKQSLEWCVIYDGWLVTPVVYPAVGTMVVVVVVVMMMMVEEIK